MKRRKVTTRPLSLGDLIVAVSSYAKTNEETVATVADLFASGQVRIMNNGRKVRARVR
jgi:S-adenosylmethionine:tRNA-ribosyltransferase-isomerase (queuine synthetase)